MQTKPASNPEEVNSEVEEVISLQKDLKSLEVQLSTNPVFIALLKRQKELTTQIAEFWKNIEQSMIENDVKSVKGDWGSVTIVERKKWKTDLDKLPNKFIKKVADEQKIALAYDLEGKVPVGAELSYTKYLTKRIK
jgi:hypothetical protein